MLKSLMNLKLDYIFNSLFTYHTARSAAIKSKYVGIVYRTVQLLILSYIIWLVNIKKNTLFTYLNI
jgi:hypothetical protein